MTDIRTKLAYRATKGNLGSHKLQGEGRGEGASRVGDVMAGQTQTLWRKYLRPCGRFSLDRWEISDFFLFKLILEV